MSTVSVSSPKKKGSRANSAKWDDDKTKILLEIFEEEINLGNRPSGIFSKQGWMNIVAKFNEKTNLGYNKEQLKNRMDNLRREFSKWETLIGKETGLGWDNVKRTLIAPDSWWLDKSKSDPSILRYKEQGPLHLDILQKVFGGITATGAHLYIPDDDDDDELVHIDNNDTIEPLERVDQDSGGEEPEPVAIGTQSSQKTSKLRTRKRKTDANGKRLCQADSFKETVQSLASTMNDNVDRLQRGRYEEEAMTYREALDLLLGLPGMCLSSPVYWKGARVLEERVRRIAFGYAIRGGLEAVMTWLDTFRDM